jgi:DNA-binding NtrC family response regulator
VDSTSLVVVVDDEPEIREILELILANAGYHVEIIADGVEENVLGSRIRARLFLIDLDDPNGSRLELVRKLNVNDSPYEVIVMAGGCEFDRFEEARNLGAIGCLHKPFSSKKLLGHVECALESAARKAKKLAGADQRDTGLT